LEAKEQVVRTKTDWMEMDAISYQHGEEPTRARRLSAQLWTRLLGILVPKLGKSSLTQKRILVELLCWSGVVLVFLVTPMPAFMGSLLSGWSGPLSSPAGMIGGLWIVLLVLAAWAVRCWLEVGKQAVLSESDPLTGLYDRRHFRQLLTMEISRVRRHSRPLSLIMFDVDDFKSINDTLGHAAGDEVLRVVSSLVNITLRDQDSVARWGGDEFVIMTPETDLLGAFQVAERLRYLMCKHDFGKAGKVTASFGVSRVEYQDDVDTFLARVDRLLYLAKERGKNVVQTEPINLVARAAISRPTQLLA